MKTRKVWLALALLFVLGSLVNAGCYGEQAAVEKRNEVVGQHSADSSYTEAKQIDEIEEWKDNPNKT